ncbi:hypothetical protein FNF31_01608 [Cafeteria roenbergensis]|uniref:P-type domain-containing protein n=1 Tax=Cafeteria roenbergensis TaxID=33653 RepID=A0A5A8DMQ5_CAFRO|nr:hypothetical protein FNF31_01608 [Cafeteria roenbergensis]
MRAAEAALLLAAVAATSAAGDRSRAPPSCAAIEARVDCGYLGIAPDQCASRGCCYEKREGAPSCFYQGEGVNVTKVHLVVSNHVDIGYTDTASNVVNQYFHEYFISAAALGAELEAAGGPVQLRWMTQAWLVDLFLNCPAGTATEAIYNVTCPNATERAIVVDALNKGFITYHAFPHNADMSLGTAGMIRFGVNMTHALDDSLGLPRKTVVSQRDVPGFPRSALRLLNAEGVDVLSEGSNSAMNPPNVPPAFLWKDEASGAEAIVMWHALGYGQLPSQESHEGPCVGAHSSHDHGHEHVHDHVAPHEHVHDHVAPHEHGLDHVAPHEHVHDHVAPHEHVHDHVAPHEHVHDHVAPHDHAHGRPPLLKGSAYAAHGRSFGTHGANLRRQLHASTPEAPECAARIVGERSRRRLHGAAAPEGSGPPAKDYLRVPGLDEVLVYAWRSDNAGPPQSAAEVQGYFKEVAALFPGATVEASTLDAFAAVLRPFKASLPVVTEEIGDTWVMSASTDAKKLMAARALERALEGCLASGDCDATDPVVVRFRKRHIKMIEHTLGLHVYSMGARMFDDWSNADFYAAFRAGDPLLRANPMSWARQKSWVINAPLSELSAEHPLLAWCQAELVALQPHIPEPTAGGFVRVQALDQRLSGLGPGRRVTMRFDPATAAIAELADARSGVVWANMTADGQSSLGLARYQTLTEADWAAFREAYIYFETDTTWAENTYGKPNMSSADPEHQLAAPTMTELWLKKAAKAGDADLVLVRAVFAPQLHSKYGAPTDVWTQYSLTAGLDGAAVINVTVTAVNKSATRLSEAAWMTFNPAPGASAAVLRSEVADVELHSGSGRQLHAGAPSTRWTGDAGHRAAHAIGDAREAARKAVPAHLRNFYAPYHADAHYEWSELPEVREAAGACDGCRLGRHRLPTHEHSRESYDAWSLRKLGEFQSPLDGVEYGGRSLQAVTDVVRYAPQGVNGSLAIESPDAGLVRWGPVSPFPLPMPGAPSENGGASFALWSNSLINTNVPFWQPWDSREFQAHFQFRFGLALF